MLPGINCYSARDFHQQMDPSGFGHPSSGPYPPMQTGLFYPYPGQPQGNFLGQETGSNEEFGDLGEDDDDDHEFYGKSKGDQGDLGSNSPPPELGDATPKFAMNPHELIYPMYNSSMRELTPPAFHVTVDKGFRALPELDCFVCQKKNHFQLTISVFLPEDPVFVAGTNRVAGLFLLLYGIKVEAPPSRINLFQSQKDRSKVPLRPVPLSRQPADAHEFSLTVGRLHFSEPTANNMRKKGKHNPEQRFFSLVVTIAARVGDSFYPIASKLSEKIIVRASNPLMFDPLPSGSSPSISLLPNSPNHSVVSPPKPTLTTTSSSNSLFSSMHAPMTTPIRKEIPLWSKGDIPNSIFHLGCVGVNIDTPMEALCVHGNMQLSGTILQPSDQRIKTNIRRHDSRRSLAALKNLNMYNYNLTNEWCQTAFPQDHLAASDEHMGIVAQELATVLPDAVKSGGRMALSNGMVIPDMLLVDKERLLMESLSAMQELSKNMETLENRVSELERENRSLKSYIRYPKPSD